MTGKVSGNSRIVLLFLVCCLAALACCTTAASADDMAQLKYLPGRWVCSDEVGEEGEKPREVELILTLEENGEMSLHCSGTDGAYDYAYTGTWSSEYDPDAMDRLTLFFTSTDNPLYAENGYSRECVYDFYTESWVENDVWNIYLLLMENASGGGSPFEDLLGYNEPALHREQGPNRQVVNCKNFVSLRSAASTSSSRLAKVPLGALVLALPEAEEENGFILCSYQDKYGYILSEYLQPVE